MVDRQFLAWGRTLGIAEEALAEIDRIASIPIDNKTVRTDCLYSPQDVIDLWESNGLSIDPAKHGFAIIGGCANGDPIALSLRAGDAGTVWYIDHERMHSADLRTRSIQVADSVTNFYSSLCSDSAFPCDYYWACKATRSPH